MPPSVFPWLEANDEIHLIGSCDIVIVELSNAVPSWLTRCRKGLLLCKGYNEQLKIKPLFPFYVGRGELLKTWTMNLLIFVKVTFFVCVSFSACFRRPFMGNGRLFFCVSSKLGSVLRYWFYWCVYRLMYACRRQKKIRVVI